MSTPVILGQTWQRKYNCRPEWTKEEVSIHVADEEIFAPFLTKNSYMNTDSESSSKDMPTLGVPARQHTTTTEKPPQGSTKKVQVEKPNLHKRWVPKNLLEAQQGLKLKWIPKQKSPGPHDNAKIKHNQIPNQEGQQQRKARDNITRRKKFPLCQSPLSH